MNILKDYLKAIRDGKYLNKRESLSMIVRLSIPVILAQITAVIMQYIDASMVGHLDTNSAASIGLISSSTWLLDGLASAIAIGFNVQVAHRIGAKENVKARNVVRYGILTAFLLNLIIGLISLSISGWIPVWLGGTKEIRPAAVAYFSVFSLSLPFLALNFVGAGMLQCSGNMKIPSILDILMCLLDVIFNFFFIFPEREMSILGNIYKIPGLGLGALGAALGTALAELIAAVLMLYFLLFYSESLKLRKEPYEIKFINVFIKAIKISLPVAIESIAVGASYVVSTGIVATLGTTAVAAHSFSITAESLCYMPSYGIGAAATTITGQCIGAGQKKMAKKLAWMTVLFGMALMTISGGIMYFLAPDMIGILSPDAEIIALGTMVLRIEAFAEPFFGASIIITGIFRGAEDTLIPGIMNLFSMWVVRIPLSIYMAGIWGLRGVWIAMMIELIFRGLIFIIRLLFTRFFGLIQINFCR
ncbi:MATE family efflux transporter [Acetitomaculum ruminis]|uniref:MATE family efflux transporter n=1 Tax=Acetitomaculum ruminis TaxID=2382 RepID=UPI001FA8A623